MIIGMQGCKRLLPCWGMPCRFSEGVPIFLGKIEWGCQISWGAKYPVTANFRELTIFAEKTLANS